MKQAGLATHFIPSSHLPMIKQQLQQAGPAASDLSHVNTILTDIEAAAAEQPAVQAAGGDLFHKLPVINRCFGQPSVPQIVAALQAETAEAEWCREALQQLQR